MKKFLLLVALLASFGAQADELNASSQAQSGALAGAQSGSAAILSITNNSPEVQTLNENSSANVTSEVHHSGTQTLKTTPSIAMSGPASGPCTGISGGVGIAGPGWGIGANGSAVMDDCRLRENTRILGMAMQSVDGAANPHQKAELLELFMVAARGLAVYNRQILENALDKEHK